MFNLENNIRKNIKALKPYSSARDEFSGKKGVFLDANESPFGTYNRYPDPYQKELKQVVSKLKNIDTNCIFLGNGSDEAIDLLFRIFCEPKTNSVLTFTPTYGMYQVVAEINDVKLWTLPLNAFFQINVKETLSFIEVKKPKIIFICSPNNPTGNLIHKKDIEIILKKTKGIVVIDEAYIDFSLEESWVTQIKKYPNLVVLQTFSKAWGLAGLRLGVAIANQNIIHYLNKVKPPYNISEINQKKALEVLCKNKVYEKHLQILKEEKQKMIKQLSKIKKIKKIYPSDANFLLIKVTDANAIYQQLISKNIIVRNRNKEIKNGLRITIGLPEENELLLNELKK